MTPSIDLDVDRHYGVGPYTGVYDHDTTVMLSGDDGAAVVYACLECGYVTDDVRRFLHEDCSRDANPINATFGEADVDL